ncbi:sodium/proton antiporter, CPA1 family [Paracoccus halophilus]|uniref:Sodium/proton antiporter, CPA1 family n=1 Tax=Paracoccus halophilus TaxID=376733 RepID=A0A099EVG7_9RHOB|nr:cation:proton antiporter [Paracoccus halophilus]KGJ02385.1 hypothetical protein IT41_17675 [Paracoccus halophilus]SFA61112.1 sodium/proton antiporter, CPA1 family [Paracoccus halophilus]
MFILASFVLLIYGFSLISKQVERTRITAPIVFTVMGILAGGATRGLEPDPLSLQIFLNVAELGLVLLLFTDGSQVSYQFRGGLRSLPGRLLSVGMLLSIALGMGVALLLFGELSIWEAGILAAILAPTDAGLGKAIVSDERVPLRIRQALNVEAGLNDGLSVPFLLFFIALAIGTGAEGENVTLVQYFIEQFGYGALIGLVIGGVGGRLFAAASRRDWIGSGYRELGFAALPILCVLASEISGASMFIAAFIAGLAVPRPNPDERDLAAHSIAFAENWGEMINLTVFFLFGLLVAGEWQGLRPVHFLYAALSLTLIRMVPVALALAGTGLHRATLLFMGWFGPRGLASIVLGLVYLEHAAGQHAPAIRLTVIATVLASILLHGLSAKPGARRLGGVMDRLPADIPEKLRRDQAAPAPRDASPKG